MKKLIIVSAMLIATTGWCDTFGHVTPGGDVITVVNTGTITWTFEPVAGGLVAGTWSEGRVVATSAITVENGGINDQPAVRWSVGYAGQTTVPGCDACRDVSADAGGVMPLRLMCSGASTDNDGGWQYSTTGAVLNCSVAIAKQAFVAVGEYTISLDAAMRTQ